MLSVGAGQAVVIDAGPDRAAVDGCLDRLGVTDVPLLVISHFHVDHMGGIEGVFDGRRVGGLLTTAWPEPEMGRDTVVRAATAHGTGIRIATAGLRMSYGQVSLTVAGPVTPMHATRSDPNNNSVVLQATVAGVTILLTGDAEVEEQQGLLGLIGRVDVLKTAHHGSAFQAPELLDELAPRIALVSVGTGNSYGHPNPALLGRLARGGARVLRTDLEGDVAVVRTGNGGLGVVTRG